MLDRKQNQEQKSGSMFPIQKPFERLLSLSGNYFKQYESIESLLRETQKSSV